MSEFTIRAGDEEIKTSPETTRLIHHHKGVTEHEGVEYDNSRFDHLAIRMSKNAMLLIFREQFTKFDELASELVNSQYESILNKRGVAGYAMDAYQRHLDRMAERESSGLDEGLEGLLGQDGLDSD